MKKPRYVTQKVGHWLVTNGVAMDITITGEQS